MVWLQGSDLALGNFATSTQARFCFPLGPLE
jgi:hypothetical protein